MLEPTVAPQAGAFRRLTDPWEASAYEISDAWSEPIELNLQVPRGGSFAKAPVRRRCSWRGEKESRDVLAISSCSRQVAHLHVTYQRSLKDPYDKDRLAIKVRMSTEMSGQRRRWSGRGQAKISSHGQLTSQILCPLCLLWAVR